MANKKLKIAHVIAEVSPYSKVGGLGDVGHALPKAQARDGHEVIVITPYYSDVRKLEFEREKVDCPTPIKIGGEEYPVSFRKHITKDGVTMYFVVNEELFGSHTLIYVYRGQEDQKALRWMFFCKAALVLLKQIGYEVNVFHLHDWECALVANYIRTIYREDAFFRPAATIYTIHNLSHQGTPQLKNVPKDKQDKGTGEPPEQKNYRNYINFMKRGILWAQVINTVSERYAQEILTPEFGCGLDPYLKRREDRVFGIINGIDYEVVNPAFDKNVYVKYDVKSLDKKLENKLSLQREVGLTKNENIPVLGVVNRLSEQKGFELIMNAMPTLLKMDLQMVVVGSGDKDYIKFFREIARKHRNKVGVYSPFTEMMASRVYAGSDIYLMPSRYEPCGISQLISLRYGSIPIVRSVGGLYDTVTDFDPGEDTGNGFTFQTYTPEDLLVAITRATESYKYKDYWNKLVSRAMRQSFSWDLPAKKYVDLYRIALKIKEQENYGA